MRYLVARGANSQAELEHIVEVAKEILSWDPSKRRMHESNVDSSLPGSTWVVFGLHQKNWPHHETGAHRAAHGETLGTAIPVTGGEARSRGAHTLLPRGGRPAASARCRRWRFCLEGGGAVE